MLVFFPFIVAPFLHSSTPASLIQVLRTSRRAIGALVLSFGVLGSLLLVGWLLGCWLSGVGRLVGCPCLVAWLLVGWLSVVGWLVGWLVVLVVGGRWSVVGCCFGWFVARSWWLAGLFWAPQLLPTTWYQPFEPTRELVGSWWWHVGAWLVDWSLGFRASGAKTLKK